MATARERAVSFLYAELKRDGRLPDEAWPEREGRVTGVLGALEAVGLLDATEARAWRLRFAGPSVERPAPSEKTREAAGELLQQLLEAVSVDDGPGGDDLFRFEGALFALEAVGAASSGCWEERLARRMGWPTPEEVGVPNVGGTQKELRAVIAGSAEAVDGVRVLCALRFDDGVSVLLRVGDGVDPIEDDPFDFALSDDVGTRYSLAGGGGGGKDRRIVYGTPAPPNATWLELSRPRSQPIRISL